MIRLELGTTGIPSMIASILILAFLTVGKIQLIQKAILIRGEKMKITKVSKDWYILKSEGDDRTLTMFGYSRDHVKQKFDSYVRDLGLEGVRRIPKIRQHMETCSFKEAVP